jgi:predicted phage terminase large subunit-like protein
MTDNNRAFRAALATDLVAFLEKVYPEINPGGALHLADYIEYLADVIGRIGSGQDTRVIVNMPPRHLKSILLSVVWPAWLLGRNPKKRIAVVSHSADLAHDLAIKSLRLMQSDVYAMIFPNTQIVGDRRKTADFETTQKGGRFAASIDSGITGRGFDLIIVDDPIAAHAARSAAERDNVNDNFDGMIASRLDDQGRGAIVIVGQRLHEDDLSGYLLRKGSHWRHVSLPLVAEERTVLQIGSRLWTREEGEVLLPQLWPPEVVASVRAANGEGTFSAQYQQNPSAAVGELIRPDQVPLYDELPPGARRVTLSFDTAVKTGPNSSYTVGLVAYTDGHRHYINDVLRQRLDPVQARDAALGQIVRYRPSAILVEDASSGPGLAKMLEERGYRCELRPTGGMSKEERLSPLLHMFVAGRVLIKNNQPWTVEFINELLRFPLGRHDDQVDALTQYLGWFMETARAMPPIILGAGGAEQRLANALAGRTRPLQKGEHPMRPRFTRYRRG